MSKRYYKVFHHWDSFKAIFILEPTMFVYGVSGQ